MNHAEYCVYPPRISDDVEITKQADTGPATFVVGSRAVGRYLRMGAAERQVIELLDGDHLISELLAQLAQRNGAAPEIRVLARFLTRLDDMGILAGARAHPQHPGVLPQNQFYLRRRLFNPEQLFETLLPFLRWIWTSWFVGASGLLMIGTGAMALLNWAQISICATEVLRQHFLWVFTAAWVVTISHEFAHGMTSKAFGGRATEVGALLMYYCIPALYCDVSGLHLIPKRGRRMWVIAAGIYWQLLVGSLSLLAWSIFSPETLAAQVAMVFVLGSLLEVVFNVNPLIKLDGYYFLSQWLRIPNLMDRSRACWAAILRRQRSPAQARERSVLLVFGGLSLAYQLALIAAVVWYASQYLMDRFQFMGLLLSGGLAASCGWRWMKGKLRRGKENIMNEQSKRSIWLRPVPLTFSAACVVLCLLPWQGSVGCYGVLTAIPRREAVIRASENASIIALNAQPGQQLVRGASIGRMGNLDLEEQIAQLRTEVARVRADSERLAGEMRVQQQTLAAAVRQLEQRRREFTDLDEEERQIQNRFRMGVGTTLVRASDAVTRGATFPAALAALEANAQQLNARLTEADQQLSRTRGLFREKLVARTQIEAAEANASTLRFELHAAEDRLNAAMVEHERYHARTRTEMKLASSSLDATRAQIVSLAAQLEAAYRLRRSLEERGELLQKKRAAFDLSAPLTGILFGEDLPRNIGQFFPKGAEVCRVADTSEMLVKVQVAEKALGDIARGEVVRLKTRAFPERTFYGVVSRIGGDSELDSNAQRSYRVELTIHNQDGLLRPGMTVFARIQFGRHAVGWLAAHKLRQALRPELWML